jgi:ATP-dependent helicase HrpB
MAGFGMHPRLSHMLLRALPLGLGGLACDTAVLLGDRDLLVRLEAVRRIRTSGIGWKLYEAGDRLLRTKALVGVSWMKRSG